MSGLPGGAAGPDPNAAERAALAAERAKELEFENRARVRGALGGALSLTLLRAAWTSRWTRPQPAKAGHVPHPPPGQSALTFVGHATFMVTTPRARILTDPVLDESVFGLRRARAAAIDAADLGDVNLVLISNPQLDHLSLPTLARLDRAATVVVPARCGGLIGGLGFSRVVELAPDGTLAHRDVQIVAVAARHPGRRGAFFGGRRGACGYVIRMRNGTIYFAGDTGYFDGFTQIGRQHAPDVALLPIGGYQPASMRARHMSPIDALYALQDLGARAMVPMAYGSFPLGYERADEPLAWLRQAADERKQAAAVSVLDHGQTMVLR